MNNELMSHLAAVDSLLAKLTVSGDNVMLLAIARQELKAAFDQIQNEGKSEVKTDGG